MTFMYTISYVLLVVPQLPSRWRTCTLFLNTYEIIPKLNYFLSRSRVGRWLFVILLWLYVISMEGNWYSISRTRQILPHLPIYQIREGTRLHSRTPPRISHRIRLTFTSKTKHTHTDMHTFNNINCRSLTLSCLINTNRLQHQQAATAPTSSNSTNRQQQHRQAVGSRHGFVRHYKLYELLNIHTQYITSHSNSCSLTV